MLLHAQHACQNSKSVIMISEDTDVLILALLFSEDVSNIYIRRGTETRTRYVNISRLARTLGPEKCKALLGAHAFTGCDSVSAFSGRGKVGDVKLLDDEYLRRWLAELGQDWELSPELFQVLQEYTCRLYAPKSDVSQVNELRYRLFRAKRGDVESGQLPPCEDTLYLHCQRANYQAAIWKRSLERLVYL